MKGFTARLPRMAPGLCVALASLPAIAGEPWLPPGNVQVRHDIELLVDSGVINLPMSHWPIAVSDLAAALQKVPATSQSASLTPGEQAALTRLRAIATEGLATVGVEISGAGRPTILRTFQDTPREEGELTAYGAGFIGSRFGARLEVTGVTDPDDDKNVRLDGSYVAGMFGNWIVTLGAQDRWWGSGWEGSLILSNNARPVPAIALDRAVSEPFKSAWLRWIGPWRLTTFMGQMESGRQDYDRPLLFGMRISARPLKGLEFSVDRTAQWCGEGRSCTWQDFWNLWAGNDNAGENVAPEDEPGNQLASYEFRWASPLGPWNYAISFQHTGESIDNHIPRPYRTLDLWGLETWGSSGTDGSSWRAGLEWSKTLCGGTNDGQKLWDCAYNNNIFNPDGYRYYGRVMGHSMDGDGRMLSARYIRVDARSNTLTAIARYTLVNEGGAVPDTRHSVAPGPEDWISLDLTYRHSLGAGWIDGGVGIDHRKQDWVNDTDTLPRAWVTVNWPLR